MVVKPSDPGFKLGRYVLGFHAYISANMSLRVETFEEGVARRAGLCTDLAWRYVEKERQAAKGRRHLGALAHECWLVGVISYGIHVAFQLCF